MIKQGFVFSTKQQLQKIDNIAIQVGPETISSTEFVQNLGYFMDSLMKNAHHINKLTSQLYLSLHDICSIRSHIDEDTAKIIIQALIMSRLDYYNSALLGSAEYQLDKLQQIQNMACRVLRELRKYDHISDHLKSLHWLKFRERIAYKVAMLVFKCKAGTAPGYLIDLINRSNPNKCILRSSTSNDIVSVFCKTSTAMKASFASAGPRIWNSLPAHLKTSKSLDTFKQLLKTYLFTISQH